MARVPLGFILVWSGGVSSAAAVFSEVGHFSYARLFQALATQKECDTTSLLDMLAVP